VGVKIRESRGKLYLDIYANGKRVWESLHLTVTPDKQQNKEIMRIAEICRSKRESQLVSGEWGLLDPISGKKTLYSYLAKMGEDRPPKDRVNQVLKYLKAYPGGDAVQMAK
jgi:hypothetical protein